MFYSYLKVRTRTLIQSKQSEMELWTHTSRATVSALSGSAVPCKKKRELTLVLWIYSRRCRRVQMFSVSPSGRRLCPSLSHRSWTSLDRPEPQSPPSPAPLTKHTQFKKQKQDVKDLKWVVASVWIISYQPVKEALTVHHPVTLGHFDVDQLLKQTAQSWPHFNTDLIWCPSQRLHPHLTVNHISSVIQSQQPHGQSPDPDHRSQGGDVTEAQPARCHHGASVVLLTAQRRHQSLRHVSVSSGFLIICCSWLVFLLGTIEGKLLSDIRWLQQTTTEDFKLKTRII